MSQYVLSTYRISGDVPGAPASPGEMKDFMDRVIALEAEMDEAGVFVFGGALRGSESASVLHPGDVVSTHGPFIETKEQIAGFYIITAPDDEAAAAWAQRVADATQHPIEVRPFAATGRVKDSV